MRSLIAIGLLFLAAPVQAGPVTDASVAHAKRLLTYYETCGEWLPRLAPEYFDWASTGLSADLEALTIDARSEQYARLVDQHIKAVEHARSFVEHPTLWGVWVNELASDRFVREMSDWIDLMLVRLDGGAQRRVVAEAMIANNQGWIAVVQALDGEHPFRDYMDLSSQQLEAIGWSP